MRDATNHGKTRVCSDRTDNYVRLDIGSGHVARREVREACRLQERCKKHDEKSFDEEPERRMRVAFKIG